MLEQIQLIISILTLIGIGVTIGIYKNNIDKLNDSIKRIFQKLEEVEENQRNLHERLLKIELERELNNKTKTRRGKNV